MQLHYLKPIPYEEYKDLKPAELAALVKERIAEKIRESIEE
jgi:1-acyl-sn-glycerol-3-phosphate acyltransferase